MVKSKIYKGIEYVQLSLLPKEQQESFRNSFNQELIIKIMVEEKILHDCITYKDYVSWFENVYATKKVEATEKKSIIVSPSLTLSVGKP